MIQDTSFLIDVLDGDAAALDWLELVERVLDSKHVIPADKQIMAQAGELSGTLISDGRRIDRESCIIAATAIQENEPILTRNDSHFERIPNLEIRTY